MSPYTTPTLPIVSAQNVVRPFAFAGMAPRRSAATVVMGDVIFAANAAPQYNTAARAYIIGRPRAARSKSCWKRGAAPTRCNGVCGTQKSINLFSDLQVRATARPLHRNLRADLDHAPGRNVEEVGGVARRFGQADE